MALFSTNVLTSRVGNFNEEEEDAYRELTKESDLCFWLDNASVSNSLIFAFYVKKFTNEY